MRDRKIFFGCRGNPMEKAEIEHKTWVIAVGNQKGGVGKTTNTVAIAAALGEIGRKCLIWDLDMNHGATRHFGIMSEAGFLGTFEILVGEEKPIDLIITNESLADEDEDMDVELPKNVHLIPARRNLEKIDQALAAKNKFIITQDVLREPLQSLRGLYDYIFLDTAPNATTPTIAAYKAADWFLLSAMPDPFAIAGLNDALKDIAAAREHGNPGLRLLGVVLSGVDTRTSLANTLTGYVDKLFAPDGRESAKFKTVIHRSTVIPRAQKQGRTIFQTHPAHKVTEQYRELVREIESRLPEYARTTSDTPQTIHEATEVERIVSNG
jgi:chromosome partitioning protein